jgi:hypothetical protein
VSADGYKSLRSEYAHQVGFERATWAAIEKIADTLIAVAGDEWRIGDGEGGGVFHAVYEAARRAGLAVGDTYSGPRDAEGA